MKIVSLKAVPITHVVEQPIYLFERPLYHLLVRVETEDSVTGYGEVCDSYGCNYPLSVQAIIDEALSPLLLGEDPLDLERLILKLRGWTRRRLGDQGIAIQAISGVEIALWDLVGKIKGESVSRLCGRLRDQIPVYASSTVLEEGPPEVHLQLLEPCLSRGVRAVKVRLGLDFRRDLNTLRALRKLIRDDVQMMVDGGEHYTVRTALEVAHALADLGIRFFEEPIPQHNREGIARLVQKSPVPIAYGEHLFLTQDFQDCLIHRRADVIQPDAAISGGISECRRIAALAETFGVPVVPHSAAGPLALAANLHLGASVNSIWMLEYTFTFDRVWREMLKEPILSPPAIRDGQLAVPNGPGLGVLVDEEMWTRYPYQMRAPVVEMPSWSLGNV
ncbi:MAG TPA: mandelate racemase/muconate lactonizing enzyme family protein [Pyrinomonadaceae bacterium]|nr:mandelate racemase/muconate lactonizing enzyme family protein [Pyrinomonadaceae bacterium]